jgi:regulator of sigma E protease
MIVLIIILVILIFGLVVLTHEFGHFIMARRGGVEVEEFGFGFPPRLTGIKRGGTLYSINLIPLGGFVKMKGEDSADLRPGSFGAASFKRKLAILVAGVVMNLLTAYVLFLYLTITGLPGSVQQDVGLPQPAVSLPKHLIVLDESKGSPAELAGIKRGDLILTAGGQNLTVEDQLVTYTKAHAGETVAFQVQHDGKAATREITLRDAVAGKTNGYLGVTPLQVYNVRYGWNAPWVAAEATVKLIWLTIVGFTGAIVGLFVHQQVSASVAGPVGIVVILSNIIYLGLNYVLFFVASIAVSLGALNALPIPALDGGRMAILIVGKLLRRQVSPQVEGMIHMAGYVALLAFMAIVTIADITRH